MKARSLVDPRIRFPSKRRSVQGEEVPTGRRPDHDGWCSHRLLLWSSYSDHSHTFGPSIFSFWSAGSSQARWELVLCCHLLAGPSQFAASTPVLHHLGCSWVTATCRFEFYAQTFSQLLNVINQKPQNLNFYFWHESLQIVAGFWAETKTSLKIINSTHKHLSFEIL